MVRRPACAGRAFSVAGGASRRRVLGLPRPVFDGRFGGGGFDRARAWRALGRLGRSFPLLLLLDPDFLFESVPELVGRALELAEALAQRAAELGQLARPENQQCDD